MASKFGARLKKMDSNWKKSEKQAKEMFTKVDPGVYLAQLQGLTLAESGAGNLQIKRQHLIIEGEFQGCTVYDNLQLEAGDGIMCKAFVRDAIDSYGYECPEELADIESILPAIAKEAPQVKIRVIHSGEFVNVRVIELLGEGEVVSVGEEAEPEPDSKYSEAEIRAMGRGALVEVVTEESFDINTEESSLSEMREAVLTALGYGASDETPDVPSDETPDETPEPAETEEAEDDGLLQRLRDFNTAQDTEFTEDDDVDALKEIIRGWNYHAEELSLEEIQTLKDAGIGELIMPAPKATKTPAKKK